MRRCRQCRDDGAQPSHRLSRSSLLPALQSRKHAMTIETGYGRGRSSSRSLRRGAVGLIEEMNQRLGSGVLAPRTRGLQRVSGLRPVARHRRATHSIHVVFLERSRSRQASRHAARAAERVAISRPANWPATNTACGSSRPDDQLTSHSCATAASWRTPKTLWRRLAPLAKRRAGRPKPGATASAA